MRISIVVDDYHGGAGNVAQLLAAELGTDHEVFLILTNRHSEKRYDLSGVKECEICLNIKGKNKIVSLIRNAQTLRDLLVKQIRTDLCISFVDNNNTMVCMALGKNRQIPVIVSERSNPLVIYPKFPWDVFRRYAYRRANLIAVQFDAFRCFEKSRFIDKCVVIPNIVEYPKRKKTNWKASTVRFVTVARFASIKRLDLMIELFANCLKKVQNIELHLYGDGDYRDKLQSQIEELGLGKKVFLHGYLTNVHETLCDYDVYLMTSFQEGFPNSLCEAMAVGLPSVSFCCHDGLIELTEHGKSGIIVESDNKEQFVEKMVYLANNADDREAIGKSAQKNMEQYNKSEVVECWRRHIAEVVHEKNHSVY